MTDLEDVRKLWLQERPLYEGFGQEVAKKIRGELRKNGIWAEISSRPKEIDSLIRKLIKKSYHSYESLGDKCGVRVILRYKSELESVLKIIDNLFECAELEEKQETLNWDQVGYLSTHIDVKLRGDDPLRDTYPPEKYRAELQVRTMAQHLWSEMSHDAFYKNDETLNPLPKPIKRRVYLLAGVVEVADDEFSRLNTEMPTLPELEILKALERHYYKLTTRRGDSEVSLELIRLLLPLYNKNPPEIVLQIDKFYSDKEDILVSVFNEQENSDDRSVYLYQPEIIMIFDLLSTDPIGIRKAWNRKYPEKELERIANAFGISFD